MTRYLALFLILFTVVITVQERHTVSCPKSIPGVIQRADGLYERLETDATTAEYCSTVTEEQELWTDYPEKGGTFIRKVYVIETGGGLSQ